MNRAQLFKSELQIIAENVLDAKSKAQMSGSTGAQQQSYAVISRLGAVDLPQSPLAQLRTTGMMGPSSP